MCVVSEDFLASFDDRPPQNSQDEVKQVLCRNFSNAKAAKLGSIAPALGCIGRLKKKYCRAAAKSSDIEIVMGDLSDDMVRAAAHTTGCSEKFVRRTLGSISIALSVEGSSSNINIGLRLSRDSDGIRGEPFSVEEIAQALTDFRNSCPRVSTWIGSGAFDCARPPNDLDRGHLLHACRTAGRLRARVLRNKRPV